VVGSEGEDALKNGGSLRDGGGGEAFLKWRRGETVAGAHHEGRLAVVSLRNLAMGR
jgi:hypothetical protein